MLTLEGLVLFALSIYGFTETFIMAVGYRIKVKPFICPLCLGFWFGVSFCPFFFEMHDLIGYLKYGFFAAGCNYLFHRILTGEE